MGKVGFQKNIYQGFIPPTTSRSSQNMERFLYRLQSPASNTPTEPTDAADLLASALGIFHMGNTSQQTNPAKAVTVAVLNLKLQTLLQDLTSNIAKEVGRIAQELRGRLISLESALPPWKINLTRLYNICMHWRKKMHFLNTQFPKYNFNKKIWRIENVVRMCRSVESMKQSMIKSYGHIYLIFLSRWPRTYPMLIGS